MRDWELTDNQKTVLYLFIDMVNNANAENNSHIKCSYMNNGMVIDSSYDTYDYRNNHGKITVTNKQYCSYERLKSKYACLSLIEANLKK